MSLSAAGLLAKLWPSQGFSPLRLDAEGGGV